MTMAIPLICCCVWTAGTVQFEEPGWEAAWVWGSKHMNRGPGYFRMTFALTEAPKRAVLQTTGDDTYEIFVNGKRVARGGFRYGAVDLIDVTQHVRVGKNVVAAVCWNGAYPGGWLAELALIYRDGRVETVASDDKVKFAPEQQEGWQQVYFDDSGWERARIIVRPPKGVWGPLPHRSYRGAWPLELIDAVAPGSVTAGEDFVVRLRVRPLSEIGEDVGMVVEATAYGRGIAIARVAPKPPTSAWRPGHTYTLVAKTHLSKFWPPGATQLRIRMARCTLGAEKKKEVACPLQVRSAVKPAPTPARVSRWQGEPTLWLRLDGKWSPTAPFIFAGSRLIEPYWQAPRRAGVKLVQCVINIPYGFWLGEKPNYDSIDLTILKVLTWCPDAYIIPRVGVDPPGPWCEKHPEECVRFADGVGWVGDHLGGTKHHSFASELWRRQAIEGLRDLVRHCQSTPYAERIVGYHVASGIYGEWHLWSPSHIPDVSEPMRRRFVAWCKNRYGSIDKLNRAWRLAGDAALGSFDQIRCPDIPARNASDLGVFKDLSKSRYCADYWHCLHETTAEAIGLLARAIKEETKGQAIVGAFYGYITDLGWAQEGGHLAVSKHLRNPDVDFLCSPHSYARRMPGQDAGFRAYPRSVRLHGKLFIDENDDRTHLAADALRHVATSRETIQLMRRGLANALGNRCGEWLFDLSGGWFVDEELAREMRRQREVFETAMSSWRDGGAVEAAVVCSPESFFTLADWKSGKDKLSRHLFAVEFGHFYQMGAPFDTVLSDDVGAKGLPRYRLWVLLNCFYLPDERRQRWATLMHDAVVLGVYAPGFSSDSGLSSAHVSELMGMRVRVSDKKGPLRVRVTDTGANILGLRPGAELGPPVEQAPRFVILPGQPAKGWQGEVVPLADYVDGRGCALGALISNRRIIRFYSAAGAVPAALLRAALHAAGAHSWLDTDDVLYCNPPYVGIHAASGGNKTLRLPPRWRRARAVDVFTGARLVPTQPGLLRLTLRRGETTLLRLEQ